MATHEPIRKRPVPPGGGSRTVRDIPDKLYFRIGEVARLCEVPAYVLRFWESEFPQLKPNKGGTGQRLYRRRDVEMALRIKILLYDEGYTIPGARQAVKAELRSGKDRQLGPWRPGRDRRRPKPPSPAAGTARTAHIALQARHRQAGRPTHSLPPLRTCREVDPSSLPHQPTLPQRPPLRRPRRVTHDPLLVPPVCRIIQLHHNSPATNDANHHTDPSENHLHSTKKPHRKHGRFTRSFNGHPLWADAPRGASVR